MLNVMRARWHLIVGRLLGRLGRHLSAARQFESVIAIYPQHLRAHLWLGWSLYQLKQHEKAIFAFEQALQIAPDSAYAHAYRGLSCLHLGRYQEAVHGLERAFRIEPKYKNRPWYAESLGWCYSNLGQFENALEAYRSAGQLSPIDPEIVLRVGRTLFKLERYQESEATLRRALSLDPGNADTRYDLALALYQLKKFSWRIVNVFAAQDRFQ